MDFTKPMFMYAVAIIVVIVLIYYYATRRTYTYFAGFDAANNIGAREDLAHNIPMLQKLCDETPGCVAFNTSGWLKYAVGPKAQWPALPATMTDAGIYVLDGTKY